MRITKWKKKVEEWERSKPVWYEDGYDDQRCINNIQIIYLWILFIYLYIIVIIMFIYFYFLFTKIIHGTLCAHNVLLADIKQCKLSDYGLSSSLFSGRGVSIITLFHDYNYHQHRDGWHIFNDDHNIFNRYNISENLETTKTSPWNYVFSWFITLEILPLNCLTHNSIFIHSDYQQFYWPWCLILALCNIVFVYIFISACLIVNNSAIYGLF